MNFNNDLKKQVSENIYTHATLLRLNQQINISIKKIYKSIKKKGKILFCGNGGSAADAQHLTAEYLVRLRKNLNRDPIPAITLAQDTSTLTACGNDFSFDDIFLRPFKALVAKNDVLICISTTGNSNNIIKVLKEAKKKKILTISFLGNGGGQAKKFSDIKLIVASKVTSRIQECHIFLGHFILEQVENMILKKNKSN